METSPISLRVAARYVRALVLPPRQILSFIGKFAGAFREAQDDLARSIRELEYTAKKSPDASLCKSLLEELGANPIGGSWWRETSELLRLVSWALGDFDAYVKRDKVTKLRNMDTRPGKVVDALEKVLKPDSLLQKSKRLLDPGVVARVRESASYEWSEKYEEGVPPAFVEALGVVHGEIDKLLSLVETTHRRLAAFVTGDVQPEKIEVLYHASVKARDIYQNGFSSEVPKDQLGLGGSQSTKGQGSGISFTYDLKAALDIARSFKEAAMIAVGDIKASTILDWGLRETELEEFLLHLKVKAEKKGFGERVKIDREGGRWIIKQDDEEGRMIEKGIDQIFKTPIDVFNVYDAYLWAHPTRLNPVHMNRYKLIAYLKDADPKDIGVVSAEVDMTNPDISSHGGEREFRVPPAAVIKVTKFYS